MAHIYKYTYMTHFVRLTKRNRLSRLSTFVLWWQRLHKTMNFKFQDLLSAPEKWVCVCVCVSMYVHSFEQNACQLYYMSAMATICDQNIWWMNIALWRAFSDACRKSKGKFQDFKIQVFRRRWRKHGITYAKLTFPHIFNKNNLRVLKMKWNIKKRRRNFRSSLRVSLAWSIIVTEHSFEAKVQ